MAETAAAHSEQIKKQNGGAKKVELPVNSGRAWERRSAVWFGWNAALGEARVGRVVRPPPVQEGWGGGGAPF